MHQQVAWKHSSNFSPQFQLIWASAYVVIVHLAPDRKSELPAILSRCTTMPVIQVADNERAKLEADHVYVIAPDRKLEITDTSVGASSFKQPRGQRTAIDLFFRSLAEKPTVTALRSYSPEAAVTGLLGTRAVKEAGGVVLVQNRGRSRTQGNA